MMKSHHLEFEHEMHPKINKSPTGGSGCAGWGCVSQCVNGSRRSLSSAACTGGLDIQGSSSDSGTS